jgi:hypothetical protein
MDLVWVLIGVIFFIGCGGLVRLADSLPREE